MNIGIDIDGVLTKDIEYENITRVYSWYDIYMRINELK